ncbi:MAG: hypothetical protein EPN99_01180 [Frankiales bacterium]|nr:MAG: hypothetical protein EPN99_01180 [Frankiales bacterium]
MSVVTVPTAARSERLRSRAGALRSRSRAAEPGRRMLLLGGILLPLGVLLVLIGWLGTARTPLVFEQVPYVVSGGLLGLALVVIGGFLYFSYWQTLVIRALRENADQLGASLQRIEGLLAADAKDGTRPAVGGDELVATATGTMLHRPDCSVVVGRDRLRPVPAQAPGMTPCSLCQPLDA